MLFLNPRNKLCFYTGLLLFSSCSSNAPNKNVLAQVDSSLTKTNAFTHIANADIIEGLKSKKEDERTRYKAEIWLPKALKVDSLAENLLRYLDSLKNNITQSSTKEGEPGTVEKLFSTNRQGSYLFARMKQYSTDLLTLDSRMQQIAPSLIVIKDSIRNDEQFNKQFFYSTTPQEAQAVLTSLQNGVLRAEETCLHFCLEQIAFHGDDYNSNEAIVGQNAKILKAGDVLEITAGLGSFSGRQLPTVTVGGKNIPLNERGFVQYKFKTSKKSGNYSLPVTIGFKDQDGAWQTRTIQVEYSLVDTIKNR